MNEDSYTSTETSIDLTRWSVLCSNVEVDTLEEISSGSFEEDRVCSFSRLCNLIICLKSSETVPDRVMSQLRRTNHSDARQNLLKTNLSSSDLI